MDFQDYIDACEARTNPHPACRIVTTGPAVWSRVSDSADGTPSDAFILCGAGINPNGIGKTQAWELVGEFKTLVEALDALAKAEGRKVKRAKFQPSDPAAVERTRRAIIEREELAKRMALCEKSISASRNRKPLPPLKPVAKAKKAGR